jgi:hypothetical protein
LLIWPCWSSCLSIHRRRIEHKVLSLRKHLVSSEKTLSNIIPLWVSNGLVAWYITHELASRARTFTSFVSITFWLVAHARIREPVATFFWTYSL